MQLLKEKGGWNRDWTVIPGIYQVYAGIYLVYTKYRNVDKRLDPTATLAHLPFIEALPYVSGYPLHLPVSQLFFCLDVHIITFLILWISSIRYISRMTKGVQCCLTSQKWERNHKEKDRETWDRFIRWQGRRQSNWKSSTETQREWTQAPMMIGTSRFWQRNNGSHDCTGWSQELSEKG